MSRLPIAPDLDIERLREEGFNVEVLMQGTFLVVKEIPYVNEHREVRHGMLVCSLERTPAGAPATHVAFWCGTHPCKRDGSQLASISNQSTPAAINETLKPNHTFSAKSNYRDFHHKIVTYVSLIEGEAQHIDPAANARTFPVRHIDDTESLFLYEDWASARANLGQYNDRIANLRVGIIGVGGTGAHILDLLIKTRVKEIHLFDHDRFKQHNAFRAPGSTSSDELVGAPPKVEHWRKVAARMRRGVFAHGLQLDSENFDHLTNLDYVFLCIDDGNNKRSIVDFLNKSATPFTEVGMGVVRGDDGLTGLVRVVTSTPTTRADANRNISFADGDGENEYSTNIQIIELNSLSAALAVIQFKKYFGFYGGGVRSSYIGFSIHSGGFVIE